MTPLRLALVLALSGLLLWAAPALAQQVFPPGSRIGLVPPPGMTASRTLQGFEDRARGAVVVVTELAAQTYAKVEQDFSDASMRAGGMELIARETIETASGQALLIGARQVENGVMMRKWALLALVPDEMTVLVVAAYPESANDAYPDAALRASLKTLFIRTKLSADELLAALPYRLTELGGFRLLRASPGGAALTFGPRDTPLPAEQPYFMVATRAAELPPQAERDRFAQRVFMTSSGRPDVHIVSSNPLRIGTAFGHEIIAESKDEKTGDEYNTVQWLLFGTDGFVQMLGIARKDQWSAVLPRMRALRDGFQSK
jgi:hypothetical protein